MSAFDAVAAEYDDGRPEYPPAVYDALDLRPGDLVLEGGCGTGLATRALAERGVRVAPFDLSVPLLRRAYDRSPDLPWLRADGHALPFRDGVADLVCFAQSWHWLDADAGAAEVARVLRPGGRWAGWWSHARADGEAWFDAYWRELEASVPGVHRRQRDTHWGATLEGAARLRVRDAIAVPWVRRLTVEAWLTDQRSHSYIAALPPAEREAVMARLHRIVDGRFPSGEMSVPYETWLWIADLVP